MQVAPIKASFPDFDFVLFSDDDNNNNYYYKSDSYSSSNSNTANTLALDYQDLFAFAVCDTLSSRTRQSASIAMSNTSSSSSNGISIGSSAARAGPPPLPFKRPSAIPARLALNVTTPNIGTPLDLNAFMCPSPFEAPIDSLLGLELALATAALGTSSPYANSFMMPSPATGTVNNSPFLGAYSDIMGSNLGKSLFDDFEDIPGNDFPLFPDIFDSKECSQAATPMAQLVSTPIISGTPHIPLHSTPFVPATPMFPQTPKVSISMEDLTALLQLASNNNLNLGPANLLLLQQQIEKAAAAVAAATNTTSASSSSASPDSRPSAGGRLRRQPSKFYTCSVENCGKQFSRNFNLKTHELTHETNRPRDFVCDEPDCGKTFVRIHDLNRHSATHDQSKWHFCGACYRGFARIDALRRHEKSGSGACRTASVSA
ncbi:hypothetical protein HK100_007282 [Physocladia obscura]|uniref:C2H2-type domain-containing protein n=1 Tax=Physocladia obscura TaxID=109957 RepID=A0AAD5SRV8_9FUNG|nr:hypothetical protein HK100_007282 [Physocladia obscura]